MAVRRTAGIILTHKYKIFAGMRAGRDYLAMPQGGIEADESPIDASCRELFEETGIIVHPKDCIKVSQWYKVQIPDIFINYRKKYSAQQYQWFYYKYPENSEITLCKHEFSSYEWVLPEKIIETAFFKREMLEKVFKEFGIID